MRTLASKYRAICKHSALLALLLVLSACARSTTEIEGTLTATPQPPGTPALVVESAMPVAAVTETPAASGTPSSAPTLSPAESQMFIQHPVEAGDTLWGLAVQYGVPMAAIQLQNNLGASMVVKAGDVLEIPSPDAWESASTYWVVYEVASGDTLSGIAAQYGLTTAELVAANGLASADFLTVGQAIILPLKAPAQVLVQAPTPTNTPFKLPTPTLTSSSPTATPMVGTATVVVVATTAPLPANIAAWPGEVWRIMNETRAAYGLPPYAYNDTLAQAAQLHAEDCSQRGSCSHTGSDGSDIKTRILRVGYSPASYAECWAVRPSPQGVIDIWMDEVAPNDPHRRTVLHTWFTEVGIGVAESPWKGYYYVIADFGKPR